MKKGKDKEVTQSTKTPHRQNRVQHLWIIINGMMVTAYKIIFVPEQIVFNDNLLIVPEQAV